MITDVEQYFADGCGRCARFATPDCSARRWTDGLKALRDICAKAGLTETLRWAHPCYRHGDRNIAILGALRGDFTLGFMNASLLKDPEGVLVKSGPNTQHADRMRFTDAAQVARMAPTIRAYLAEAIRCAEAGTRPLRSAGETALPDELVEALDADPELAEAFHNLTPGRRRSYAINLQGAKTSATRIARIQKFRPHILAGKGAMER